MTDIAIVPAEKKTADTKKQCRLVKRRPVV